MSAQIIQKAIFIYLTKDLTDNPLIIQKAFFNGHYAIAFFLGIKCKGGVIFGPMNRINCGFDFIYDLVKFFGISKIAFSNQIINL